MISRFQPILPNLRFIYAHALPIFWKKEGDVAFKEYFVKKLLRRMLTSDDHVVWTQSVHGAESARYSWPSVMTESKTIPMMPITFSGMLNKKVFWEQTYDQSSKELLLTRNGQMIIGWSCILKSFFNGQKSGGYRITPFEQFVQQELLSKKNDVNKRDLYSEDSFPYDALARRFRAAIFFPYDIVIFIFNELYWMNILGWR